MCVYSHCLAGCHVVRGSCCRRRAVKREEGRHARVCVCLGVCALGLVRGGSDGGVFLNSRAHYPALTPQIALSFSTPAPDDNRLARSSPPPLLYRP